jgi:hypothetical protein
MNQHIAPVAPQDATLPDGAGVTPSFLRYVGELLYGERWQTPLAASLGQVRGKALSPATVHQWTTRKRSIPAWVQGALSMVLEQAQSDMTSRAELAGRVARNMRSSDAEPAGP